VTRSTAERSRASRENKARRGETTLRLPAMDGTKRQLQELMAWHGITEMAEAMTLLIHNVHAMGREGSSALLYVPRHKIEVSQNVAHRIRREGERQAQREDQEAD
jgi:hypothetical protein